MNNEWVKIENVIDNLGEGNELSNHVLIEIGSLKSNIISLLAFKLNWNNDKQLYKEVKKEAKDSIDNLICWNSGCNMYELREIKDFIEEKL
jgi:hypothetical protein